MSKRNVQSIADWEKQRGYMLNITDEKFDTSKKVTSDEFDALNEEHGSIGVDYEMRTEFLEKNGYELTRANYMDSLLHTKEEEETEE